VPPNLCGGNSNSLSSDEQLKEDSVEETFHHFGNYVIIATSDKDKFEGNENNHTAKIISTSYNCIGPT